jgi:hypothetical protein
MESYNPIEDNYSKEEFKQQLAEAREESERIINSLGLNKRPDYEELRKPFDAPWCINNQ